MGVEEGAGDIVLQLSDGHHQGVSDQGLPPHQGPIPLELTQLGQAELVGEVAPLVPLLVMLVFVEGQRITGVLILICLEVVLHTYNQTQHSKSA